MNEVKVYDIANMLDELGMTTASLRWKEILSSPELGDFTAQQMLREVITPQYVEMKDNKYRTNLRLSKLVDKTARADNCKTSSGRRYNDDVVQQIFTFDFVSRGLNAGIYGRTGAGKTYLMSAVCDEACHQNYRSLFVDYTDLMDELLVLSRKDNLERYTKKLKYYSRIKLLFLDDFAISRYSEDGINVLYHLIKSRADLRHPTIFTSQYAPAEWGKYLGDEPDCYGKLDGIRRRLVTGYTVTIEKL